MKLEIYNSTEYAELVTLYREIQLMNGNSYQSNRDSYFPQVDNFLKQLEEVINDYEKTDPRPFTQSLL